MDAYHILVLILGGFLLLFLILGIVASILLIKILRYAQHALEQAAKMADTAMKAGEMFKHASTPMGVGRLIVNIMKKHGK